MFQRKGNRSDTAAVSRRRLWIIVAAVCLLIPSAIAASENGEEDLAPSGVVYVESNIGTPGGNSIFAFRRDSQGNLTPLPGSPFLTGGTGIFDLSLKLGPFDSDQNVIANPEHTMLFAVNSGSNSIAVFNIATDGSLSPVEGSPFPSGGVNPVSVGLKNNILTVVNKDEDPNQDGSVSPPNYTTFRVTPEGKLIPIPYSTVPVAPGSSPSQALTMPTAPLVFSTDFLGGLLESFVIERTGRLTRRGVERRVRGRPHGLGAADEGDGAVDSQPRLLGRRRGTDGIRRGHLRPAHAERS
jgi:hypothetical protein